jgi:DNA replication protein DnaC
MTTLTPNDEFATIARVARTAAERLVATCKARGQMVRAMSRPEPEASSLTWDRVPGGESVRRAVAQAMAARRYPIYLHGPAGVGKSSLMRLVFDAARSAEGIWAIWRRADEALYDLAMSRDMDRAAQKQLLHRCGHLFLDDIGTRQPSPQMYSDFFDLLEARAKRPLWITSNVGPEGLVSMGYDDRIYTRMLMGTVIEMQGENQRTRDGKRFLASDTPAKRISR